MLRTRASIQYHSQFKRTELLRNKEAKVMKAVVAYDSVYGNTKLVAEAVAEQIRSEGHEVELISVKDEGGRVTAGDFMFVGSPTRMGRMTKNTKRFLEGLDVEPWKNKPIVAFDTVGPLPTDEEKRKKWLSRIDKGAAYGIQELVKARGLNAHPDVLHIAVTSFKGPLASDGLSIAKDFAHRFMSR
jgi:flavodoxin